MNDNQTNQRRSNDVAEDKDQLHTPSITLPKGGGAIRSMGEKFAANPVTGTGSLTVPIALTPGRSGFGPQLTLSYDSGAGNGAFGFGWNLALPSVTRKTDKGLPQYLDADESDVFLLSGVEDLVPVPAGDEEPALTPDGYHIQRYCPRIEGLFARIERWTEVTTGDIHWRSISRDNIATVYGKTGESRITDPSDPRRIFTWLISECSDDKGNVVLYGYKSEDGAGADLSQANERNRGAPDDPRRKTNRYLKHICYGNRVPLLDDMGQRPRSLTTEQIQNAGWMFEVVLDYGEHDSDIPTPADLGLWTYRHDPFSSYRAGFEVRTTRLCQRVLMFHHFADEAGVGNNCLVCSTDFTYSYEEDPSDISIPIYTFLLSVTQSGYKRHDGGYLKRSLPPLDFVYTRPIVQDTVQDVDLTSLENLPMGLDGIDYQWTDLHGEGISGILSEQASAWFYTRNISPMSERPVEFAPQELVVTKPNLSLGGGQARFMDLAGDGQLDLVMLGAPIPGFYEHDDDEGWLPFRAFTSRLNRDTRDPNLKFVDLDGDGYADVLISEDDALVWHSSLAEEGFGPARRVQQALDEERGPRLVFADGSQSMYLADLSGDGLTDLVRIRNGEICYWPNLGYGHFGAKVLMDNAPYFDLLEQFDHNRIRLTDIDGSGTTDIIYLHSDGVRLYFNQSGNSWSPPRLVRVFPRVDNLVNITSIDLLGNGTACLVWSSPLPGDTRRQMRYVDLMGGQKPHLLVNTANNLGAETRVEYASSTKFYLQDRRDGHPWITKLPFPVHVVERVETYDHINHNRFVTRYAYHHGYFDGVEREFRGFGMVEQFDTEMFAAFSEDSALPEATNLDAASHVPPIMTKTWFHTGVYVGRAHVSDFFAGLQNRRDRGEYYREPAWLDDDDEATTHLLPDTVLPDSLTSEEEREACRALKGMMLRQEVYALDGVGRDADYPHGHPYTVAEQSFTIRFLQARGSNRHAVFLVHANELLTYHYEREPSDPRIQHALTLEVDGYGNVLKAAAIGYGRRVADPTLPLDADRLKQTVTLVTYTENDFTQAIDDLTLYPTSYRTPLPAGARMYELTGYLPTGTAGRYQRQDFVEPDPVDTARMIHIRDGETAYEAVPTAGRQRRLIEHVRILYRKDDLSAVLPFGRLEPLALPGESYRLAFTPGLLAHVYQRPLSSIPQMGAPPPENLLPDLAAVLPLDGPAGQGRGRGGYVDLDGDGHWWVPSGRVFLSPGPEDTPVEEQAFARRHFFLPHRYRDPFHTSAVVTESLVHYDSYDLLMQETRDALGNRVTVGERDSAGNLTLAGNDYRVLQPRLLMDANRNRAEVVFDALGMVVGTATMGKPEENFGDSLDGFDADLSDADALDHLANPLATPHAILGRATTRLVYDLFAYQRTQHQPEPQPAVVYSITRETHASELASGEETKLQHRFIYSDGFGREIQTKAQAEPGPVSQRDGAGQIIIGSDGQPLMTTSDTSPRWLGSGWKVFNNKGKPVRQYEPFFTDTHRFEFDVHIGVSPVLFYDPLERAVVTLHPNHTWQKVVPEPWRLTTYDVNDTVVLDPQVDEIARSFFLNPDASSRLPVDDYLPTWHALRTEAACAMEFAARYPDPIDRANETRAATKAAAHANTPTTSHLDTLGRPFLTVAHNRVVAPDHELDGSEALFQTRVELDVEGNQRVIRDAIEQMGDALGRIVVRYDYDMLGNAIHHASIEAGERWMLNDVSGKPLRAWDSRGHAFRSEYDPLRRPLRTFVTGADPDDPAHTLLTDRFVYGEQHPEAESRNLRGKLYLALDRAGTATNEAHDFKGNPRIAMRRQVRAYKQALDWQAVEAVLPDDAMLPFDPNALEAVLIPLLEADTYISSTTFDALNRPLLVIAPHSSAMQASTIRLVYNEASLLEHVDANLRGAQEGGQQVWTPFVANIDYDSKGRRTQIDYGNGVRTSYTYDPLTFRLTHLLTRRNASSFPDDCPPIPSAGGSGCQVQNLHYTYDPIGNIMAIRDDAQQTIFFRNRRVEPSTAYTYDAIYRLIEATGREHLGQNGSQPNPPTRPDAFNGFHTRLDHPGDGNAMGTFVEQYVYDAVGNFLKMLHRGSAPPQAGWTHSYAYDEPSLLEDGKQNNRLSRIFIGMTNGQSVVEPYTYDAHGNIDHMPHLSLMAWDYHDQLQATSKQVVVNGGTPEITYYVYDAAGQRVRKVTERQAAPGQLPVRKEERIYLGGFEIYREYESDGETIKLERETLHIMDGQQRVALVESRTQGNDSSLPRLVRFQHGNHIGSATLELDDQAQIISYEEYLPYGSTSYQAGRSIAEVSLKRYRYTAEERDDESGFSYHGARYYADWVGRWTSSDPIGIRGGVNLYCYCNGNCVGLRDSSGTQPDDSAISCKPASSSDEPTIPRNQMGSEDWFLYENGMDPAKETVTGFERDIMEAANGEDKGRQGSAEGVLAHVSPSGQRVMVGQHLSGDELSHAQAIRCSDPQGRSVFIWMTQNSSDDTIFWSREGTPLMAIGNKSRSSMEVGFGASLLNPVDFFSGWLAGKLVGRGAKLAADVVDDLVKSAGKDVPNVANAFKGEASTALRGVADWWVADAEGQIGHLSPNRWFSRWLPGRTRLVMSRGPVDQGGLIRIVNRTARSGRPITILSGTHGTLSGQMASEVAEVTQLGVGVLRRRWVTGERFFLDDAAVFTGNGHIPGVQVLNVSKMSGMELRAVLSSGADVYAAWCHSALSCALGRAFDAVNAGQ